MTTVLMKTKTHDVLMEDLIERLEGLMVGDDILMEVLNDWKGCVVVDVLVEDLIERLEGLRGGVCMELGEREKGGEGERLQEGDCVDVGVCAWN